MSYSDRLDTLRAHVAAVAIPDYLSVAANKRQRSRLPSAASFALGALFIAAPAFAGLYSYYAADNTEIQRLAKRLSIARHETTRPDIVISPAAPIVERVMAQHGFSVIRSATFSSGAMTVEVGSSAGPAIVLIDSRDFARRKSILLIPQGPKIRYLSWRSANVGSHNITVSVKGRLPDAEFWKIARAASDVRMK